MKFTGQWLPDDTAFRKECVKIAGDLTDFKKNPVYCRFINNDNRSIETAMAFHQHIKENYPYLLGEIANFKKNDIVGSPTLYRIGTDFISPGTLRFIKVLGDIMSFEPLSIVEIGSGYGGQCKTIRSFIDIEYTLIDIPESLAVAKAYLNDDEVYFMSCEKIGPLKADLVISDYCISEMNREGIDFYLQSVVQYCNNGYFTCNDIGFTNYLVQRLREMFHQVTVQPEKPKTSKHVNIIVYAMGNRNMQ